VIGVFMRDENRVEAIDVALDGGEARESFAFSKASVNEDASGFRFEQGQIARTAGGEDGDAQADEKFSLESTEGLENSPCTTECRETLEIMAEG
jgi:hypothetical protein